MLILWGCVDFLRAYVHHGDDPHMCAEFLHTITTYYGCLVQALHKMFPLLQIVVVGPGPFLDRRLSRQSDPFACNLLAKYDVAMREISCDFVEYLSVLQVCEKSPFVHNLADEFQIQKCTTGVHLTAFLKSEVCSKLCGLAVRSLDMIHKF